MPYRSGNATEALLQDVCSVSPGYEEMATRWDLGEIEEGHKLLYSEEKELVLPLKVGETPTCTKTVGPTLHL